MRVTSPSRQWCSLLLSGPNTTAGSSSLPPKHPTGPARAASRWAPPSASGPHRPMHLSQPGLCT
jgi:hypothetical protein